MLLTNENVLPLFALADKYAVMPLRGKCVDFFKGLLTAADALSTLIAVGPHYELRQT